MANVDPRTPIIKATEDEQDEVEGHLRARGPVGGAEDPFDARYKARDEQADQGEQEEVEGHLRAKGPEGPSDLRASISEGTEDDDEVQGHLRVKGPEGPSDLRAR